MKYLLDTHVFLWSIFAPEKMTEHMSTILINTENEIYISQISFWEIAIKYGIGKLKLNNTVPEDLEEMAEDAGFDILPLHNLDILSFYHLPKIEHNDPFDRLLIWQAIKHNFILLSHDAKMGLYKDFGLRYLS